MKTPRISDNWHEGTLRRLFTLDQANASLVLVSRIVADIVCHYQHVLDCQEIQEQYQRQGTQEQAEQAQQQLLHHVEKLQGCADELAVVGVELKDWALGIVDFPAILENREVRFCWQHGEDVVKYYHNHDADCGRRQEAYLLAEALPG
jgi:hypothetical protein